MTLLLTLERSPQPQAVRQMTLEAGELVIGRGAEAGWRIDDPDLFVSRAHCRIAGQGASYSVTDTSSGGLFVDEGPAPLGQGRSVPLRSGARLRLGDYVIRVEIRGQETAPSVDPPARAGSPFDEDGFFASRPAPDPPRPRPSDLPQPFEDPAPGAYAAAVDREAARPPPLLDDPFSLDPLPSREPVVQGPRDAPPPARDTPAAAARTWGDDGWNFGPPPATARPEPLSSPPDTTAVTRRPDPGPTPSPAAGPAAIAATREAFLRGLGLDPAGLPPGADPAAEMEAYGRQYRLMMEGLMHLLRKRAEEKSNARIARTTIGSSEVNPLKFLPGIDDALAVFAAARSPGFLPAESAIAAAVRDLAQHHVDTWRGVQGALARMLDRFDPAALEEELKSRSSLETLLAGGRRAKLWELYEQRYREIARNAEARFLGEVGADFREAYEDEKER